MSGKNDNTTTVTDREVIMTRLFDAPRELVFAAWTDPKHVQWWWGPRGFTTTTESMEVKPGGVWRFCMHGPDGRDYANKITYLEVVKPERLVYKNGGDAGGEPVNFHVTVTFEDVHSQTRLTMRSVFPSAAALEYVVKNFGAVEGGKQHVARLGEYVATLQGQKRPVATFTRTYDAPRARVFQAWTDPAQLAQWWGPRGFTNPVCHLDVRPGGQIRIDMRAPDGTVFPMAGVFDEVVEPERLVFTCYAHPDAQGVNQLEVRNTVVFTEHEGKTTINVEAVVVKATGDAADAVNGMEAGWMQSLERLAELSACAAPATKPFIISRVFEAPRELVYKVWTEQKHLIRWGGPKGTTVTVGTFDFRPGGMYHTCVRGPEGKEMWGKWAFREIVPLERLVFVTSFSDAAGNLTRHPLSATWPLEMLTTVTFTEAAGRTTVTIQWDPLNATPEERATFAASRDGMQQGWTGMLDTLTEYLATCGA